MKVSILIIAFHFPPAQASSGLLRCLSFARSFRDREWDVTVLTASHGAAARTHRANESLVPQNCTVVRAPAWDAAKRFSVFGKYPSFLDIPDRFGSWILGASVAGLIQCMKRRPNFILSSYPIASAHVVGYLLSRILRVPWIADFRDPMILPGFPETAHRHRAHQWIERQTVRRCSAAVFTNQAASNSFRQKYPDAAATPFLIIENGFDDHVMAAAQDPQQPNKSIAPNPENVFKLVHNGALYRDHRDPRCLFRALVELKEEGLLPLGFFLQFRASGEDRYYSELVHTLGLSDVVVFAETVDYVSSYREACEADGLLLVQGRSCNNQVPAKIYEYCAARKPIVALTDKDGATAEILGGYGVENMASLDDAQAIKALLCRFFDARRTAQLADFIPNVLVEDLLRSKRGAELADRLEDMLPAKER